MIYALLHPYIHTISGLNVIRYITFRTGMAILTGLVISFLFGDRMIHWLKARQGDGQPIRTDGPEGHLITKKGTPTMGGLLILIAMSAGTFLWADLGNMYVWILMLVTLGFGALGAVDDYQKLTQRSSRGISAKAKIIAQVILAVGVIALITWMQPAALHNKLALPLFKDLLLDLGWFYFLFGAVVIVGTSNAVNLTDGLDGLAIVPVMIAASCFALIAYLVGNHVFATYLQLHYVPGVGELAIACGALIGAGLGFLWFNAPPARIFMGDTGSLAAGGALGALGVMTKHELVLAIIGGLFVVEAVSVIIQVLYFKKTGRRVFLMAPIHHHFEKKGWSEPTIVVRFWIIATILALIGLSTLKLR